MFNRENELTLDEAREFIGEAIKEYGVALAPAEMNPNLRFVVEAEWGERVTRVHSIFSNPTGHTYILLLTLYYYSGEPQLHVWADICAFLDLNEEGYLWSEPIVVHLTKRSLLALVLLADLYNQVPGFSWRDPCMRKLYRVTVRYLREDEFGGCRLLIRDSWKQKVLLNVNVVNRLGEKIPVEIWHKLVARLRNEAYYEAL